MPDALYTQEGGALIPGAMTQGPWSPGAQHGGAVASLLARTVESAPAPGPLQLVRLTVELLRPVPMVPLTATAEISRPGRKVQLVDARITADGRDVAWARGLRIRTEPVDVPAQSPHRRLFLPPPTGTHQPGWQSGLRSPKQSRSVLSRARGTIRDP